MGKTDNPESRLVTVSIIAGIIYYFYLLCLAVFTFRLFGGPEVRVQWHKPDLLFLGLSFALFISLSVFYQVSHIHRNRMNRTFRGMELLVFIGASLLFCFSLYSLFMIPLKFKLSVVPVASSAVVLCLLIFLCIIKVQNFIFKVIVVNFFIPGLEEIIFVTEKKFEIMDKELFLDECERLVAISGRFGTKLGLLGVRLSNLREIESQNGLEAGKFIRKQFIFLITENSRLFEPWTRNPDKDIYIKVVEVRNELELKHAEARFLGLVKGYEFTVLSNIIAMEVRTTSLLVDKNGNPDQADIPRRELIRLKLDQIVTDLKKN